MDVIHTQEWHSYEWKRFRIVEDTEAGVLPYRCS